MATKRNKNAERKLVTSHALTEALHVPFLLPPNPKRPEADRWTITLGQLVFAIYQHGEKTKQPNWQNSDVRFSWGIRGVPGVQGEITCINGEPGLLVFAGMRLLRDSGQLEIKDTPTTPDSNAPGMLLTTHTDGFTHLPLGSDTEIAVAGVAAARAAEEFFNRPATEVWHGEIS